MGNDIGGVWRTVGGRRIFIKDGQSLGDAMKRSGKFKKSERMKELKKSQQEESDIASELSKRASSFEERQELEKGYEEYKKNNSDGTLDDYMYERHIEKMRKKGKERDKQLGRDETKGKETDDTPKMKKLSPQKQKELDDFADRMERHGVLKIENWQDLSDDDIVDRMSLKDIEIYKDLANSYSNKDIQKIIKNSIKRRKK